MQKTIHKKLTDKFQTDQSGVHRSHEIGAGRSMHSDIKMLQDLSSELLQPRPEAIAKILSLAKML